MLQLVLTNINMDLSNFIIYILIHCLLIVGLHTLYLIISIYLQTFIAPREKGFEQIH